MSILRNVHPVATAFASIAKKEGEIDTLIVTISKAIIRMIELKTTFRAVTGKGDGEVVHLFTLDQMFADHKLADGKVDGRFLAAAYRVVISDLGIDDFPNFQMNWLRAWRIAMASRDGLGLVLKGSDVVMPLADAVPGIYEDNGALTAKGKGMAKKLQSDARQAGKKMTDAAAVKKLAEMKVVATGGIHPTLGVPIPSLSAAALIAERKLSEAGVTKAKASRSSRTDAGKKFGEAVEFIQAALVKVLDPKGTESDFAPSDELVGQMIELRDTLAAFLATEA